MSKEKINWPDKIPEISEELTSDIIILSQGGRYEFDIDYNKLGEDNKDLFEALIPLITDWLNNPIYIDEYENSKDRANWEDEIDKKFGKDSLEHKFRKSNRIRLNSIGVALTSIQPIVSRSEMENLFDPEELEILKQDIELIYKQSKTVSKFLFNRYQTVQELRALLSKEPCIFIESDDLQEIESDKVPLYIVQDLLIRMCSRLEDICLKVLNKLSK